MPKGETSGSSSQVPRGVDKECPLTPGPDRPQTPENEVRFWRADYGLGSAGREIHERAFVASAARPAELPFFRLRQIGSIYGDGGKPGFPGSV